MSGEVGFAVVGDAHRGQLEPRAFRDRGVHSEGEAINAGQRIGSYAPDPNIISTNSPYWPSVAQKEWRIPLGT
jgi:hypothetical protein